MTAYFPVNALYSIPNISLFPPPFFFFFLFVSDTRNCLFLSSAGARFLRAEELLRILLFFPYPVLARIF